MRTFPLLAFRLAARPADHDPLRRSKVENPGLRMLVYYGLQSPGLLLADATGKDDAAALHRGHDAPSTRLVHRVERNSIVLQHPPELHNLPQPILVQLDPLEIRSPEPRKPRTILRQDHPPPVNLRIKHGATLLNLNRNYT